MRFFRLLFVLVALGVLAACGGATANVPTAAPAQPTTANTPTNAPPASTNGPSATTANEPTNEPTASANQPVATAASTYNGVPTSRTVEGYHVLGDPNAPITIEHFSDFL